MTNVQKKQYDEVCKNCRALGTMPVSSLAFRQVESVRNSVIHFSRSIDPVQDKKEYANLLALYSSLDNIVKFIQKYESQMKTYQSELARRAQG